MTPSKHSPAPNSTQAKPAVFSDKSPQSPISPVSPQATRRRQASSAPTPILPVYDLEKRFCNSPSPPLPKRQSRDQRAYSNTSIVLPKLLYAIADLFRTCTPNNIQNSFQPHPTNYGSGNWHICPEKDGIHRKLMFLERWRLVQCGGGMF